MDFFYSYCLLRSAVVDLPPLLPSPFSLLCIQLTGNELDLSHAIVSSCRIQHLLHPSPSLSNSFLSETAPNHRHQNLISLPHRITRRGTSRAAFFLIFRTEHHTIRRMRDISPGYNLKLSYSNSTLKMSHGALRGRGKLVTPIDERGEPHDSQFGFLAFHILPTTILVAQSFLVGCRLWHLSVIANISTKKDTPNLDSPLMALAQ